MEMLAAPDAMSVDDGLRAIVQTYRALAEQPVACPSDARLRAQADAAATALRCAQELVARIAVQAERSGTADRDGAVSAKAWMSKRGLPFRDAARALEQGQAMTPELEPTRLAWARGEICGDRAEAIATAVAELPDDAHQKVVEAAQAELVEHAKAMTLRQLRTRARRLVEQVDPGHGDRLHAERLAQQEA